MRQHGHSWLEEDEGDFPSFWEGLSLRLMSRRSKPAARFPFPFLVGRAIIEAGSGPRSSARREYFPSFFGGAFIEASDQHHEPHQLPSFPFLSGRDFIEDLLHPVSLVHILRFPFLFGRAFIEAVLTDLLAAFPVISLPSGKGFH